MNFHTLVTFVKVVQTRSFKETAKQLRITQPAVTQRIQALEENIGVRLLIRDADGVQLTTAGTYVYQQSLALISQWENLLHHFQGHDIKGRIVIGASTIPAAYLLPQWLSQFHQQYPEVELSVQVAGTSQILQRLREGTIDVAITGEPSMKNDLFLFPIHHDQLQIIAPPSTPSGKQDFPTLLQQEWIFREEESDTRHHWIRFLKEHGYTLQDLQIVGEMGSSEAIIASVEAGLGWSVVSQLAAQHAVKYGRVSLIHVDHLEITRSFYFSTLVENQNQGLIQVFAQYLKMMSPSIQLKE